MLSKPGGKESQEDCFTSVAYTTSRMECFMKLILSSLVVSFSIHASDYYRKILYVAFVVLRGLKHRN